MNGYGMTEVGAAVSVNYRDKYEFGSVGLPFIKNTIAAFDVDSGEELRYGEEGELCIYTPSVMLGYINNPKETANILRKHSDGLTWVHTGDLGYISEDGFIHISGRLKRFMLYINNGVQKKIFSLDIEKVLFQNENIKNCVVVPKDDLEKNQIPVAFVILNGKNKDAKSVEEQLVKLCESQLDVAYRPVKYYFVEEFPLTKVGKVDYRALEKEAKEQ